MVDKKTAASHLPMAELRRALPLLAAFFALLALWFGWSGVQQWRESRLEQGLQQARDTSLAATDKNLTGLMAQLTQRVAAPPVQASLRAGDTAAAAAAIGRL